MSDSVIRVENLSKRYVLSHQQDGRSQYKSLRDVMADGAKAIASSFGRSRAEDPSREDFWALRDVNFEIKQGDRVGIIGRNGAGKSTLLKVLSRIVEPTGGRIGIRGRVASLLEVGTGFHPELTGRENIYLNGAILGMSRAEITRKFDEIVAFAEVERFLDTPVKRYSSGMYVRLAFAVAAHLEPEILIVDEVLAVGDAQFQKKCLGKMGEVAAEGRTVLFVSHNMSAINAMCNYAILMERGSVKTIGAVKSVTDEYFVSCRQGEGHRRTELKNSDISINSWKILDQKYQQTASAYTGEPFIIEVDIENKRGNVDIALGISVETLDGTRIFSGLSSNDFKSFPSNTGAMSVRYLLENLPLNEGSYYLTLAIHNVSSGITLDRIDQCMAFEVVNRRTATGNRVLSASSGLIVVHPKWSSGLCHA